MFKKSLFQTLSFLLLASVLVKTTAQNTLRLSPENPHYLEYKKKAVLLITSAEHYGLLMNLDFDYIAYLDALAKQKMNNTRIFSGAYVEREADIDFMKYGNTLAPQPNKFIAPWKRSTTAGYANGGNKFDLDQWDQAYFKRMKQIVTQAANRGIVIEFTLFGNQYKDSIYMYSPLYPDNNIQGVGRKGKNTFLDFQSLKDTALVRRQTDMVVKIVTELNAFDNIYYEISNEPYNEVKDSSVVDRWDEHMAKLVKETEQALPKKHLVSSNQAVVDSRYVDVANYHYVHISNMPSFDSLLHLNKVISMNETVGSMYDADVNDVRVEAWDFLLHGGSVYNNLSWEYTPFKPKGTLGADSVRSNLQYLQQFMSSFNFVNMKYSPEILSTLPQKAITRVLAEEGKQYALHIHHSRPFDIIPATSDFVSKYEAEVTTFTDTVSLTLPAGNYSMQWYNPSKGRWIKAASSFKHTGGKRTFFTPTFITDIALRIIKK